MVIYKKTGQASIEYVILVSFLILATSGLIYITMIDSQIRLIDHSAKDVIESLGSAADLVYSLGPCSKTYEVINIPPEVIGSSVSGHSINLKTRTSGDVHRNTIGPVIGYIPTREGVYKLPIEHTCWGSVVIGYGLSLYPEEIILYYYLSTPPKIVTLNVTNNRDTTIKELRNATSGNIQSFTTITDLKDSLSPQESDLFTATFNNPGALGTYEGEIIVKSPDAEARTKVIMVVVDNSVPTPTTTTTIQLPFPGITCAQACVNQGYATSQCKSGCGGSWTYANIPDADEFCEWCTHAGAVGHICSGTSGDTCCCSDYFVTSTTTTTTTTTSTTTTTTLDPCQQACNDAGYGQARCQSSCSPPYKNNAPAGDAYCSPNKCCCK
ncbi:MAG: hypothetical protein QXY62_02890 [Candidatus Altiarchaeota archaeon]